MKGDLPDIIADIYTRLAEIDRRRANGKRTGTIHEVDDAKGLYRVKLGTDDDGAPFLTPWMPNQEMAMGDVRIATGLTVGEQVDIVSETGDLSDAMIATSIEQDKHPRPPVKAGEYRIRREADDVEIYLGPDKTLLKAKGATLTITSRGVRIAVDGVVLEVTACGIAITGDMTQTGIHTDSLGRHTP